MQTVTYIKRAIRKPNGTFGILRLNDLKLFTVERPWVQNENNVSCIPVGRYLCKWTLSPRLKKYTYEVMQVPKRSGIRIHSANFPEQVLGCIALGNKFGTINGKLAVLQSTTAIRQFEQALNKQDFLLEVQ